MISQDEGIMSPAVRERKVDFPDPDGPTRSIGAVEVDSSEKSEKICLPEKV